MIARPFALRPDADVIEAMREVVKRHYPVYPVCDAEGRLLGVVRGAVLFEEQAFEISAQAGEMGGVAREDRLTPPGPGALRFRPPWLPALGAPPCSGASAGLGVANAAALRRGR